MNQGWYVVDLSNHNGKVRGFVVDCLIGGTVFLRVDVPTRDGGSISHYFAPSAILAMTPTTEEMARAWCSPIKLDQVDDDGDEEVTSAAPRF